MQLSKLFCDTYSQSISYYSQMRWIFIRELEVYLLDEPLRLRQTSLSQPSVKSGSDDKRTRVNSACLERGTSFQKREILSYPQDIE